MQKQIVPKPSISVSKRYNHFCHLNKVVQVPRHGEMGGFTAVMACSQMTADEWNEEGRAGKRVRLQHRKADIFCQANHHKKYN